MKKLIRKIIPRFVKYVDNDKNKVSPKWGSTTIKAENTANTWGAHHIVSRIMKTFLIFFIFFCIEPIRLVVKCVNFFYILLFLPYLQHIRVAQRITRLATNQEIAGSNPVTDKWNFLISWYKIMHLKIFWLIGILFFRESMWWPN